MITPARTPTYWALPEPLVLASASPYRRRMLEAVAIPVSAHPAALDERVVEERHHRQGGALADVAGILAGAKALAVSAHRPGALVLGADQTLSHDGALLHKAQTPAEAIAQLRRLSGQSHQLTSAFALVRDGEVLAAGENHVTMRMRALSAAAIAHYAGLAGQTLTTTVGGYALEGIGAQLFEAVEGDYFTVLGLPLLQVLASLRALGALQEEGP